VVHKNASIFMPYKTKVNWKFVRKYGYHHGVGSHFHLIQHIDNVSTV